MTLIVYFLLLDTLSVLYDLLNILIIVLPIHVVRIEEIIDDDKPVKENDVSRPKNKKSKSRGSVDKDNSQKEIAVKSDNEIPVMESEDEDGFPISGKKEASVQNTEEKKVEEKATEKKGKDNDASLKSIKRKIHAIAEDGDQLR